jgi:antitoxin component YwqK of YwqJK toxin-antitoxin module
LLFIIVTVSMVACKKDEVKKSYYESGQLESETSYTDGNKLD